MVLSFILVQNRQSVNASPGDSVSALRADEGIGEKHALRSGMHRTV